jgi:hypothetical protein
MDSCTRKTSKFIAFTILAIMLIAGCVQASETILPTEPSVPATEELPALTGIPTTYPTEIEQASPEEKLPESQISVPNPDPPSEPVKLIFIHHSCGENWLADDDGGLGIALRDNNYFVSDTNYGWGPDSIGDQTDIIQWPEWFLGSNSSTYLDALYTEYGNNSYDRYSRSTDPDPNRENEIILFKSCFPNSNLDGNLGDPPAPGEDLTVGNAKYIYTELLNYFATRTDKLFIAITAPPVAPGDSWAPPENTRAFNNWLVNDWLEGYPYQNVAVFDFFNVLTSNGGDTDTNDLGQEKGNHHRWWN